MTQQTEKLRAELSAVQASETNLRSKLAEMQEAQRCEEAKMRRCSEQAAREAERCRQSEAEAAKSIKEAEAAKKKSLQDMTNVRDKAIKDCQAAAEEAKTERATVATLRTELQEKTAQVAELSELAGTQDALAITSGSSSALSGLQLAVCENVDRHLHVGLPGRQLLNTFLILDNLADTIYKQASKDAGVDRHPGTTDTNPKVSFQNDFGQKVYWGGMPQPSLSTLFDSLTVSAALNLTEQEACGYGSHCQEVKRVMMKDSQTVSSMPCGLSDRVKCMGDRTHRCPVDTRTAVHIGDSLLPIHPPEHFGQIIVDDVRVRVLHHHSLHLLAVTSIATCLLLS